MKSLSTCNSFGESFIHEKEKLVSIIVELAKPEVVFLLGESLNSRKTENIFSMGPFTYRQPTNYFLLVLIAGLSNASEYEWQDKIEVCAKETFPITSIVMRTSKFGEWLIANHPFAVKVAQTANLIYNSGNISFVTHNRNHEKAMQNMEMQIKYKSGLNKAGEFLAGADLFRIRQQSKMSAFMLHQSAEQSLRTLFEIGTGFRYNSHNIERLMQYASMLSGEFANIFPQRTERDITLFKLLKKAYIDARYKEDYKICVSDLLCLTERVRQIHDVLRNFGENFINSFVDNIGEEFSGKFFA